MVSCNQRCNQRFEELRLQISQKATFILQSLKIYKKQCFKTHKLWVMKNGLSRKVTQKKDNTHNVYGTFGCKNDVLFMKSGSCQNTMCFILH